MTNPLLRLPFEIPWPELRPEHVEPAFEQLVGEARAAVESIGANAGPYTYRNTLGALDAATRPLEQAATVVGHLESVATSDELRKAWQAAKPKLSAFYSQIPTDAGLYRVLRAFAETPEAAELCATRRRLLDKTLREFRRHGAELDESGKAQLSELDVALAQASMKFGEHVLDGTTAYHIDLEDETRLAGLPKHALALAQEEAKRAGLTGYRLTLHAPSLVPALTYLDDAQLRQELWHAYDQRAATGELDNGPLIERIVELRRAKAQLLGYADFADLVLEERMAKSGAAAEAFVDDLRRRTEDAFLRENAELRAFRRELEGDDAAALEPWDVAYYAEKLRRARFDFDAEELRPYFRAESVVQGLFALLGELYGVVFRERDMASWHESARCFEARDESGALLGAFTMDLFPRAEKRGGAWMNGLQSGVTPEGECSPNLGLICGNLTPPNEQGVSLLSHAEVETIFHEMGHLMHHILNAVDVHDLSGTNVAWDFVELPSQIMENFCWERESLDLFARHYETGEPIPDELLKKLRATRTFRAANAQMRQLGFAKADLALHRDYDPARDGAAVGYARAILGAHAPAPVPDDYAMITSFTHLFGSPTGYAAGYYSYKWAEVLDADAFARFLEAGVLSREVGDAFRDAVLSRGDSEDPEKLFENFMHRKPSLDALLRRTGLS
ncbi:MAG: M3 family metallopeptidase [Deltaproteobacteria bacterium]|nr:M3 family metallopeptidase [Deltaproteobacteria bacterium]